MERMDQDMPFLLQYEHVAWFEDGRVRILDRRVYPTEVRFVECTDYHEVVQAIADMVTQSAGPYTAVGMGMALAAWQARDKGAQEQEAFLQQAAYDLAHARPTTANRYGQITYRCADVAKEALAAGRDPVEAIVASTVESLNRRYSTMQVVGDYLADLIPNGGSILTQCFGETIIGTVIRAARRQNKTFRAYCAETRPYLQGRPAHVQLLCPDGHRDHGPDGQHDRLRHGAGGYRPLHLGGGLHRLGRPYRQQDRHLPDRHPGQVFRRALLRHRHPGPGEADEGTTSSSRCGIPPRCSLTGGIPNTVPEVKAIYPSFDVVPPHLISGVVTDKGVYVPYLLGKYFDSEVKQFY